MARRNMVKVKINFMGYLSDFTGIKELELEFPPNSTLKDLLNGLKKYVKKLPKMLYQDGEFKMLHLMINFQDVYQQQDGNRPLAEGDALYLIPPIGGG